MTRAPMMTAVLLLAVSAAAATRDAAAQNAAPRAQQRVILVTGSTDGLGREVARRLAARGAHVIVHGRNAERGTALVEEIRREGTGSAAFYAADLASLEQVRTLAQSILRDYERLDVLVNNAGVWLASGPRQLSADGHELHFAVNYLAGYTLTRLLLPLLTKTDGARIVNVASAAQNALDFDDVMLERGYSGSRAYGQSKLAQILFTIDLAAELHGRVSVNALHPATLMNTTMVEKAGARPRSTVEQGAEAVLELVNGAQVGTGQYFSGLRAARADAQAYDSAARDRLRALSIRLTGVR